MFKMWNLDQLILCLDSAFKEIRLYFLTDYQDDIKNAILISEHETKLGGKFVKVKQLCNLMNSLHISG